VTQDEFDGIDIGRELRAARPVPSEEFVPRLAGRIRTEQPERRLGVVPRPVLVAAATAVAIIVAGAFGGISEAAYTVEHAVTSIVHVSQKKAPVIHKQAPHHSAVVARQRSSSTASTAGSASVQQAPPIHLPPVPSFSVSPSDVQYAFVFCGPPKSSMPCVIVLPP
jgi:hypothetical protein